MVVKMMRWRPWPPLITKKFEVKIAIKRLENLGSDSVHESTGGVMVEIKWKGPPKISLASFRKTVRRNCTREEGVKRGENDVVFVDEEFHNLCSFNGYNNKDNVFHPWEISFTVFNGMHAKNKAPIVGSAVLNLSEFAAKIEEKEFELNIPVVTGTALEPLPSLSISLSLLELRAAQESAELVQRPLVSIQSPAQTGEIPLVEKDELSALKAGLRKVKIFTEYVSTRRAKKACREEESSEGRCSTRSEEGEYAYPFDSNSDSEYEGESDEAKEDPTVRKSFSYGPLAYANCVGVSFHSSTRVNSESEDWVYYSHRRSDVGCSQAEDQIVDAFEPVVVQNSKRSILPWRKRKLSFRSPKSKGEPLLKKDYGDEGGDDIDFDRRQLSSDESLSFGWHKVDEDSTANQSSISDFGDDNFAVGCWEQKEIISRDGQMKLETQVFFASIDQRSEQAAGASACTALVAVIADWLQNNRDLMPIKSQFESLIREGSLEWRNLCENETYREQFPDKHFDLETVLQAKVRPISVVPGRSFIGFFHPEGMDEGRFDFLHGAMSFDNIWDEISRVGSEYAGTGEAQVYIISWNDHFFILKVEAEAYYIIDTLGERLHEGCRQAYILKFDKDTAIYKLPSTTEIQSVQEEPVDDEEVVATEPKPCNAEQKNSKEDCVTAMNGLNESMKTKGAEEIICQGKESCKDYIKSFLAALPIRELQEDVKKGLITSSPLHHRLQIEFHFTLLQPPVTIAPAVEVAVTVPQLLPEVAITEAPA